MHYVFSEIAFATRVMRYFGNVRHSKLAWASTPKIEILLPIFSILNFIHMKILHNTWNMFDNQLCLQTNDAHGIIMRFDDAE